MRLLVFLEDEGLQHALLHEPHPAGLECRFAESDDELARALVAHPFEAVLARKGACDFALARLRQTLVHHAPSARLYLMGLAREAPDTGVVGLGDASPAEVLHRLAADYSLEFPEPCRWELLDLLSDRVSWQAHLARCRDSGLGGVVSRIPQGFGREDLPSVHAQLDPILAVRHPNLAEARRVDLDGAEASVLWGVPEGGTSLGRLQRRLGGRLAPEVALAIAAQLAEGLGALHAQGFVHGWFDEDAVWVSPAGEVVLLHAGIGILGEALGRGLRGSHRSVPPQHGLAPEELQGGRSEAPADVFRLGTLLFWMLEKRFPFTRANNNEELRATVREPAPVVEAPARVAALVDRLLAKEPRARPADGRELRRMIEGVREGGWLLRRAREPRRVVAEALAPKG